MYCCEPCSLRPPEAVNMVFSAYRYSISFVAVGPCRMEAFLGMKSALPLLGPEGYSGLREMYIRCKFQPPWRARNIAAATNKPELAARESTRDRDCCNGFVSAV